MLGLRTIHTPSHLSHQVHALFHEPYGHLTAPEILRHFSERNSIAYFPVIDPVETQREKIENILCDTFEFNGETQHNLAPIPWTHNPSQDQEWLILLHKFYYAVGLGMAFTETLAHRYLEKWVRLTDSWINLVPLNFLPSDVAGRRIQNWIFAHYFFVTQGKAEDLDPEFYIKFLSSLAQQVSFLCRNLTPARNHRTLELCSIFLAGVVFPELREASNWLELAKTELVKNIQSDILPDGVHCELSTDYHHLVLKNFLWIRRLAILNHIILPSVFDDQIKKALEFSLHAHKPDGMVPSLSDGDSRSFLALLEQGYQLYGNQEFRYTALQGMGGTPPQERSKGFPDSGYYFLRSGWGEGSEPYQDERYLIFDCGPLGEGNHGHLDLLSFEMAAYGQSLIVDPGRYTYDESGEINWRVRFRETAAHNTVVVDGKNQTRYVFHKTRYKIRGSHPNHFVHAFISEPTFDFIHGLAKSHEYPVLHERKILFPCLDYWVIIDRLTAQEEHQYDLLFHLSSKAQDAVTVSYENETLAYAAPHVVIAQPASKSIHGAIFQGYVSQTYGSKDPAPILQFRQSEANTCFHTILLPYKDHQPDVRIDLVPVYTGNRMCPAHEATCLRIRHARNQEPIEDIIFLCHKDIPAHYRFDEYTFQGKVACFRRDLSGNLISHFEIQGY